MSRVHIVEDDREISELLSAYLARRDFDCYVSGSAEDARRHAPDAFDILIVDVNLPGQDGLAFCQWVRSLSQVPILILSAQTGDTNRINGIELGADDYLEKPFNPRELLARMNALLRRGGQARPSTTSSLCFGEWVLDRGNQKLLGADGLHLPLSNSEYELLTRLVAASPAPIGRDEIARAVMGVELGPEDRRVDILVSRLRKKLAAHDPTGDYIRAVRNRGYQFCAKLSETRK